ncbi:LytTR family DNA-binding domain-containing protein [Mucilaginibacter sp.]|uniref:LytR/AlgR family response regulator transcription factor n=1 Tax=Mucilaginibacter sp. TaxID=1882438 RepID=UPI0026393714|nr:LytTR family DNA-binding domain-containing protein [Mucilaginibacter sp.]MDB4920088.1 Two component transcriptional regulator, LytTR family [Mucilaginibacter sp.]
MNCIAIDDEPRALEVIERYCTKSGILNLQASFREPLKAIEFLNCESTELVFLDINMPGINGIELLSTLAVKPMVIFTTAYSDYAVESYHLNAIDYLLKPITFERFLTATNKALNLHLMKSNVQRKDDFGDYAFVKSGAQTYQVKISEILYLEKDGNYISIVLKDKKILIRQNMADIFEVIPVQNFVRVHKSFVVAIRHIAMVENHQLIINGDKIPIGSTYRDELKTRLGLV